MGGLDIAATDCADQQAKIVDLGGQTARILFPPENLAEFDAVWRERGEIRAPPGDSRLAAQFPLMPRAGLL